MAVKAPVLDGNDGVRKVLGQGVGGDDGAGGLAAAGDGAAFAIQEHHFARMGRRRDGAEIGQGARQMHHAANGQKAADDHRDDHCAQPDRHGAGFASGFARRSGHRGVRSE